MEHIKDIVRKCFMEATHKELRDSDWDTDLDTLGLDIIKTIDFIMLLERDTKTDISDESWSMMSTPNDVAKMLEMLLP
jgi:acyl carrier protein